MMPFKDGAFKIATKTGCAIVPISMNNTGAIFENQAPRIKKTHVILEYGTPIYPGELPKEDKKHIGSYCYKIIQDTIQKDVYKRQGSNTPYAAISSGRGFPGRFFSKSI